jgi:catechol 2,3-dioxygenase-like lactoylglutathione lyase family enzyme
MGRFLRDVLGLMPITVDGAEAELFAAGNTDVFGVARSSGEHDPAERTIGFLVDDLDGAVAELDAAGVGTDGISENARWRYTHFRAPDGRLYELLEERGR